VSILAVESVAMMERPPLVRIRSHSARFTDAIAEGTARSATFRHLVETIGASDGIVYVEEGVCRHGGRACFLLSVTITGPFRVLQIRVNLRKTPGCTLIESIGHEFRHVIEVLRDRRVRTHHGVDGSGRNWRGQGRGPYAFAGFIAAFAGVPAPAR
jgi:hypothetical protein